MNTKKTHKRANSVQNLYSELKVNAMMLTPKISPKKTQIRYFLVKNQSATKVDPQEPSPEEKFLAENAIEPVGAAERFKKLGSIARMPSTGKLFSKEEQGDDKGEANLITTMGLIRMGDIRNKGFVKKSSFCNEQTLAEL